MHGTIPDSRYTNRQSFALTGGEAGMTGREHAIA